jgi:MFS family permease
MLSRAVSLGSTIQAFGRLGGPALAAILYAWRGPELIFSVNAISYLAVVVALTLLNTDAMFPRTRRPGQRAHLSEALRYAWNSPVLRPALLGNALVGLFAFNFGTFFAMTATLTFGQPSLFGLAESLNAITAILAGFLLARYLKTPTLLTVGLAGIGLGSSLAWVALAPSPFLFLASMPYFGFAVVVYGATAQALVQHHSPREMAGRMMSLYTLGTMGTTPIGGLIVGWVSDQATTRVAVGLGATSACLVGLLLLARWWWDRRATGTRVVLEADPENPRIVS